MVTQDARSIATDTGTSPERTGSGTQGTGAQGAERKVRIVRVSPEGTATLWGAVVGALALVWVLYERVLPFSGVLGFWLCWYAVFLVFYASMARMQWDRRDVINRLTMVAFAAAGVLVLLVVL